MKWKRIKRKIRKYAIALGLRRRKYQFYKWFFREIVGIPYHTFMELRKRHRIFKRDGYKCVYCGSTKGLTIDHYIPKARGGSNSHRNLVTSCHRCNQTKGSAHPEEIARTSSPNTTVTIAELMEYKHQQRSKSKK